MKAADLTKNSWFTRPPDIHRVFMRLPGPIGIVDGKECVPVKPLQPTAMMPGFYLPSDTEVVLHEYKVLRLM